MKKFIVKVLGCPKNLVDGEHLSGALLKSGFSPAEKEENAEYVFLLTCAFVEKASEESEEEIKKLIELKNKKKIKFLSVGGCLPQRKTAEYLYEKFGNKIDLIHGCMENLAQSTRITSTYGYAYLKIAEGCDEKCLFCVIPKIRGKQKSIRKEILIQEAKALAKSDIKEIILISQSTGQYGKEIYGKPHLLPLLKEIVKIKGIEWIRILYLHPADCTKELLHFIKNKEKMCRYLDIPIQHISERILKSMRRRGGKRKVLEALYSAREIFGNKIFLRTEIIIGYPLEKDKDFEELIKFIEDISFERLTVIPYSREIGTPAFTLKPLPEHVIKERMNEILKIQRKLLLKSQKRLLEEKSFPVLIESKKHNLYKGRTMFDAPLIDCNVYVQNTKAIDKIGIYPVKFEKIKNFDLYGKFI